jgi:hypothetical protein
MKKYYHGTSTDNFLKILKDKKLITNYYMSEDGIYITENFWQALPFGEIVMVFELSEGSNFHIDDVNDGIFYKGGIDIKDFEIIISFDGRIQKEMHHFAYLISKISPFVRIKFSNCIGIFIETFTP